jgi:serine/threonine protein kinase
VYIGTTIDEEPADIRDLKLENILLDKSENIKLVDFGFTREYDPRKLLETWCGSYSYAAPEIIQAEKYSGEGTIPIVKAHAQLSMCGAWELYFTLYCVENSRLTTKMRQKQRQG